MKVKVSFPLTFGLRTREEKSSSDIKLLQLLDWKNPKMKALTSSLSLLVFFFALAQLTSCVLGKIDEDPDLGEREGKLCKGIAKELK